MSPEIRPKTEPQPKKKKPAAALAREWEKKLAKEGLAAEPGADKAAALLRAEAEAESGPKISEADIRQKIQEYWVFREGVAYGDHRRAAADIADQLGIATDDVPEDLMKEVESEVAAAEKGIRTLIARAVARSPSIRFRPDQLRKAIDADLRRDYDGFSPMALEGIINTATEEG